MFPGAPVWVPLEAQEAGADIGRGGGAPTRRIHRRWIRKHVVASARHPSGHSLWHVSQARRTRDGVTCGVTHVSVPMLLEMVDRCGASQSDSPHGQAFGRDGQRTRAHFEECMACHGEKNVFASSRRAAEAANS